MTKISQVLKTTKKKQTVGDLVKWKWSEGEATEPKSYCALGVLACNKNMVTPEHEPTYEKILIAYKVPKSIRNIDFYRELDFTIPKRDNRKSPWNEDGSMFSVAYATNLYDLIVNLNDRSKLNFKEIGEFLETNLGL